MHQGGLFGAAVALLLAFASPVTGLSNTSPFVLLSESRSLRQGVDVDLSAVAPTMNMALESIVSDAALTCDYDAYVFVKHPHIGEREVSERTMPWLAHAAKKVRESVLLGTVVGGADAAVDKTAKELQQNIAKKCNAKEVSVDVEKGTFEHYADTRARVLVVDLTDSEKSPSEVDTLMRDIVGHLPSPNFLLAYRTTPVEAAAQADGEPERSSINSASKLHATSNVQAHEAAYESVFRNYQFFSPGIFMGLLSGALALFILLIALRAVGSLQISPAAFEPRRQAAPKKSN